MACVHFFRLAPRPGNCPDILLDASGVAGWIRKLSSGIFSATTRVNERVAIGRKSERGELLAIVFEIRGQPTRFEIGALRDPNVALAAFVEGPSDTAGGFGSYEIGGKRRAEDLLKRESFLRMCRKN